MSHANFGARGVRVLLAVQYFINRMLSIKQQLATATVTPTKCPETKPETKQKLSQRQVQ